MAKAKKGATVTPMQSWTMIESWMERRDPAKWAALMLTRRLTASGTIGDAIDAIEATVARAIAVAIEEQIVACPGCDRVLFSDAKERGICAQCEAVLSSSKKLNKECPECKQLAPHGGIHNTKDGTMCPYIYGRRGWRQMGEYDS